ncbi:sugar phosphate isomerase/epimerase family protein [Naasia lichenicola]|uniref:Sugar phosphate isomerase/epimerase n=1 Tax=Naasia lichenicola TaxID=2565933 RepID=A0A4S4FIN8_9MICO|nr:sugar phosphate isomerase/epimerase family protein [Naasia lichenicola]THG29948.1 sugar phosphate isomerase/epimerase [Naasia lichenicola]
MPLSVACHLNVLVPDLAQPALDGALEALAELGYSHVVLPPIDPEATPFDELNATFRRWGLSPIPIAGQAPDADVSSEDPGVRQRGEDALRRMVDATVSLGGTQLNGVPYGLFGGPESAVSAEMFERSARHVGAVADYADERGVAMTFEVLNRYETSMINTAQQARDYVAASGSANLRIHLDSFHMAIEEGDMLAAVGDTVPQLGYLELGQSGRGGLGAGVVDAGAVVRAAIAAGYQGPVGVEAFSRSILSEFASDLLRIWRAPYADGRALAAEAIALVRDAEASAANA